MKAFVTGGTGFLGRRLIAALLAHGDEVVSLVRTFDRARSLPPEVRTVAGDISRPATMRVGMRGADVVFHAAAWHRLGVRPKDAERLARTNVAGTRAVLELAGELGVPNIVYTSTVAVYGDTGGELADETWRPSGAQFESVYERSKYQAHFEVAVPLQDQGLPLTIVCPGVIYGPGDTSQLGRLLRQYARRRLPVMLGAESAFTWAHVDDIAAGQRLAAERGLAGETYILAGPALSYREFFAAAERATGLPAPRLWLPAGLVRLLAHSLQGVRPSLAEMLRSFTGVSYLARSDKAQRDLGWQARPVQAGLPETVAWFVEAERQAQAAARLPPVPAQE